MMSATAWVTCRMLTHGDSLFRREVDTENGATLTVTSRGFVVSDGRSAVRLTEQQMRDLADALLTAADDVRFTG